MMSFRGSAIPVVDLSIIAFGTSTPPRMMTRIVVVRYEPASRGEATALLGLIVPEVMQTAHFEPGRFEPVGVRNDRAPYLGPVLTTRGWRAPAGADPGAPDRRAARRALPECVAA